MNKIRFFSTSGLLLIAAFLLMINLVSSLLFTSSRLDLTEDKLFTVSEGTENILQTIDEPITLRFYFSEKVFSGVPGLLSYGHRVRDLLDEYVDLADGKLKLIAADPEPFSDTEDEAVQYGLQGVPVDNSGGAGYFGLIGVNSVDDQESIVFFRPDKEDSLEYDLTRLIYKLINSKQPVLGLASSLPIFGAAANNPFMNQNAGSQEWFIVNQLRQFFDVQKLETNFTSIPSNIDILMLVHPKDLAESALFAIDQFILQGGRAIVFVDPFSEVEVPVSDPANPMSAMTASRSSSLDLLFKSWGLEFVPNSLAADRDAATRVNARSGQRVQAMDYIVWLSLNENNFNQADFITSDLKVVNVATPGFIKKDEISNIEFTPLLSTGSKSMSVPVSSVQFGPNPAQLLRDFIPSGESMVIAARIRGKVKSAFPDGIEVDGDKQTGLLESANEINLVVVADTDLLEDKQWVNLQNFFGNRMAIPRANNDAFVINAVENLSGNNDLISLRGRGKSARPFQKVLDLQQEAESKYRDTEKLLQEKLQQAERKLAELQREKEGGSSLILSPEQKAEIEKFRDQQVQTRKELRTVQHELGKNIESLGTTLKILNIALIPVLIIIIAGFVGMYRIKRLNMTKV